MGDAMTHRKLIAFAASLVLTLCGIAVAQQQGIGWHFDMMRAMASGGGWVNPDPNASDIIFWYSFDNVPLTNSAGRINSDIPSGTGYSLRLVNSPTQNSWQTNEIGVVDYGVGSKPNNWSCILDSSPPAWQTACSAMGIDEQFTQITVHASFVFTNMNTSPRLWEIYTRNDGGTVTNYLLARGTTSITVSSQSNGVNEANVSVTGLVQSGFYQLTITYKTNEFRVYKNAVLVGSDASCLVLPFTNDTGGYATLAFGAVHSVRDFRVYRKALSGLEVTNLVSGLAETNPLWIKPVNLVP
jgi:hypothetical protein